MAMQSSTRWHSYLVPVLAALMVHALLAFLVAGGFQSSANKVLVTPNKVIRASLVELQKKPQPSRRSRPEPVTPDRAKPAQASKQPVKPLPAQKRERPASEPVPPVRNVKAEDEARRQREAERLEKLFAQEEAELAADAEFERVAAYVAAMRAEITSHWSRPPSARNYVEVQLSIRLLPNGDVISVAVKKGSGNAALDRSAVHAVEKVGRFDMLRGMPIALFDKHFRNIDLVFRPEDLRL